MLLEMVCIIFYVYSINTIEFIFLKSKEKLFKMLHHGNVEIVSFLKKLPQTDHDSNTFKLDTTFFMVLFFLKWILIYNNLISKLC